MPEEHKAALERDAHETPRIKIMALPGRKPN